jgi:hypothetical protein
MLKPIWHSSAAIVLCLSVSHSAAADSCSPVMDWNKNALQATTMTTPPQGALVQIRSLAIVHVSMHDAVNGITGRYETYRPAAPAPPGASPQAAAIAAASYALTQLFPAQGWGDKLEPSLTSCGLTLEDAGVAYGRAAAQAVLASRVPNEVAATADPGYVAPGAGAPGVWTETAVPASPKWGQMKTWVLERGDQFRPEAPPALDSGRYARDLNEVKLFGAVDGSARTPEQTNIAIFWDASPSAIWNSVARGVIEKRHLDLSSTARTLALMYLSGADASIACFDAKYVYNFWRPIAAIRRAAEDGNEETLADPLWSPLIVTHPHPEYPSGHSTNSGAMATTLALLFGDAPGVAIEATSPRNPAFPRTWATFSEGVDEVIAARVYIGFHFRSSDQTGARIGRQVARFVVNHALREE